MSILVCESLELDTIATGRRNEFMYISTERCHYLMDIELLEVRYEGEHMFMLT